MKNFFALRLVWAVRDIDAPGLVGRRRVSLFETYYKLLLYRSDRHCPEAMGGGDTGDCLASKSAPALKSLPPRLGQQVPSSSISVTAPCWTDEKRWARRPRWRRLMQSSKLRHTVLRSVLDWCRSTC